MLNDISPQKDSSSSANSQLPYDENALTDVLNDTARFPDAHLRALAENALEALDDPAHAIQNEPAWVSRLNELAALERRPISLDKRYTTAKMLRAMYDAADACGLPPSAQRYVSAAIYVSTLDARESAQDESERARRGRLATALERLATLWVAYMLWPCKSCTRFLESATSDPRLSRMYSRRHTDAADPTRA